MEDEQTKGEHLKKKKNCERTRDLIYLKFVETDFFPKITRVVNVETFMGRARHVIWPNKKNLHFSNSY